MSRSDAWPGNGGAGQILNTYLRDGIRAIVVIRPVPIVVRPSASTIESLYGYHTDWNSPCQWIALMYRRLHQHGTSCIMHTTYVAFGILLVTLTTILSSTFASIVGPGNNPALWCHATDNASIPDVGSPFTTSISFSTPSGAPIASSTTKS